MRKAFTMLEMIFVIAIMSVISVMTFGMISQYYEAYIQKEAAGQLETETKVIIEQIANHLQNAIKESVVVLDGSSCLGHISQGGSPTNFGLAWVGEDVDSRMGLWDGAKYAPGWSGYANLASSTNTTIVSQGSDFTGLENIIFDLSGQSGTVNTGDNLLISNGFSALYFVGDGTYTNACSEFINYNAGSGYPTFMYPVASISGSTFTVSKPASPVKEHYKLAWSAYAILYNSTSKRLELVYNFRPWNSETISTAMTNTQKITTLGENISNVSFKYESGLIRFNVCIKKTINGYDAEICKEKVVF